MVVGFLKSAPEGKLLNLSHKVGSIGQKHGFSHFSGIKIKSCTLFCVVFRVCCRPLLANFLFLIANMNSKFANLIMCEK